MTRSLTANPRPRFLPTSSTAWRYATLATCLLALITLGGCVPQSGTPRPPDKIIGRRGIGEGKFQKPRAIAIDSQDRLFVVDMTGRIQLLSSEGEPLKLWRTPEIYQGKPTGLTIAPDGQLMVADTHYYRILFYDDQGNLNNDATLGGENGTGPGQFGLVTDVVLDSQGNYYVSEYGEFDRVQKFAPDGSFIMQWGQPGNAPGEFSRPNSLAIDQQDHIWVADACNHRIQVFEIKDNQAKLIKMWGNEGTEPGQLRYPYDLVLASDGSVVVAEYGNHRIQKFSKDGQSLAIWGGNGKEPGQLYQPWGIAEDSQGRFYVLDSFNHRIQRFRF